MIGRHISFVILIAVIHEATQTPFQHLGKESQVDRKDDDENGILSSEHSLNSTRKNFVINESNHNKDNDEKIFEGDIQINSDELREDRSSVNNRGGNKLTTITGVF